LGEQVEVVALVVGGIWRDVCVCVSLVNDVIG